MSFPNEGLWILGGLPPDPQLFLGYLGSHHTSPKGSFSDSLPHCTGGVLLPCTQRPLGKSWQVVADHRSGASWHSSLLVSSCPYSRRPVLCQHKRWERNRPRAKGHCVKLQNNGVQEKILKAFRERNQQTERCLNPPWLPEKHHYLCFEGSCLPGIRGLAKPPIRLEVRIRIFFQKCRFPKRATSLLSFSRNYW